MTRTENYLEDANIETLERLYSQFCDMKDAVDDFFSPEARVYFNCSAQVYEELSKRGEEDRGLFLMLRRDLAKIETEELLEFHRRFERETICQNVFQDDFTADGDPVTDAASIYDIFMWFLETELKKREVDFR